MKNAVNLLIKAAVTMTLVACAGQSSDPLKEHKDVKGVPAHHNEAKPSTYTADVQSVQIVGTNEDSFGNFIEGKQGEILIQINPKVARVEKPTFTIDFPLADEPQIVDAGQNKYRIVWTPKAGVIAPGKVSRAIGFAVIVEANGQFDEVRPTIVVNKTSMTTKITGIDGLPKSAVNEGDSVKFTVDVLVENYDKVTTPELMILPYRNSNTEAFMANGSVYVEDNKAQGVNPAEMGKNSGAFRFYYIMRTRALPDLLDRKGNVDPNAASVQLCFNISAAGSGVSVERCVKVNYAAQPAQVTFAKADRKVKAGESNVIDFTLSTLNAGSAISVKDADKQIKNLSGDKNLVCTATDDKNTQLNCVLAWTPTCVVKSNTASSSVLKLKVDTTMNQQSKSKSIEEKFEVDQSGCEAIAKAKAEADKKAKEEAAAAAAAPKAESAT